MGSLTIDLFAPGMTLLHRAGLAGLWLTLDTLDEELAGSSLGQEARRLQELGRWECTDRSVTLMWEGKGTELTDALLRYAYPVTGDGLLHFAALGDPLQFAAASFATHQAMLATFLQHNKSRKAESGKVTGRIAVQVEDATETFAIRRVASHSFATAKYDPEKAAIIAGWLVPGGVVRHTASGFSESTSLAEAPGPMLALRFAPIGCLFFLIRHYGAAGNARFQTSIVVPDVNDLVDFAELRRLANQKMVDVRDLYTAGPAEAALRLLALDAGRTAVRRATTQEGRRCRVMTYGTVAWSSQQRTRVVVLDVGRVALPAVRAFQSIRAALPARRVQAKTPTAKAGDDEVGRSWVDVPQVPELAAENLIHGRPWWRGFADFVADKETREHVFRWERKGLSEMVQDPEVMAEGPAVMLVRACQTAWRRRLRDLWDRARDQGLDYGRLVEQEFERTRIAFSRCKTQAEFRRTVTDFWARGGTQAELQRHWVAVLPFLTDRSRWEEGRDLALLALASYASQRGEGPGPGGQDDRAESGGPVA